MKATLLNVQRFCTSDGPGIRTTVFLKGCPLRCLWCHNPESQSSARELLYDGDKCVHCLRCVPRCPVGCHTATDGGHVYDRTHCLSCGQCLSPLCEALEAAGSDVTVDEVLCEVLKDRAFYESSGGGLTLSGGEPLFHADFAAALLERAKAVGLHTCVETCGFAPKETLLRVAPLVDLFLFDVKETDPTLHERYTGAPLTPILENLRALDGLSKETVLRCPIIPGLNDREGHLSGIAELAKTLRHVVRIEIEPYHTLGAHKYARLGRGYALDDVKSPDKAAVDGYLDAIRARTSIPVARA